MNLSIVASDMPSIFIAFLDTKSENSLMFLAGQAGFTQLSVSVPLSFLISVLPPHAGQVSGT